MHSRTMFVIALLAGAAALGGCQSIQEAAGRGKASPDEFAVVTKAPLTIPPDFNLKPPAPGAAPANQIEPTQAAQNALFSADAATVASSLPATMSEGERYMLAAAGVQNADPSIRQQLASDRRGMRASDDSFASSVLFWNGPTPPPGGTAVDADAEARRIDAARAGNANPAPAGAAPAGAPPPDNSSNNDGSDSGGSSWWPF
jgi:hypothetical protein